MSFGFAYVAYWRSNFFNYRKLFKIAFLKFLITSYCYSYLLLEANTFLLPHYTLSFVFGKYKMKFKRNAKSADKRASKPAKENDPEQEEEEEIELLKERVIAEAPESGAQGKRCLLLLDV